MKYIINEDNMGNMLILETCTNQDIFLQSESDKETIYDVLSQEEKEDLYIGLNIEILDAEPRASVLESMF